MGAGLVTSGEDLERMSMVIGGGPGCGAAGDMLCSEAADATT